MSIFNLSHSRFPWSVAPLQLSSNSVMKFKERESDEFVRKLVKILLITTRVLKWICEFMCIFLFLEISSSFSLISPLKKNKNKNKLWDLYINFLICCQLFLSYSYIDQFSSLSKFSQTCTHEHPVLNYEFCCWKELTFTNDFQFISIKVLKKNPFSLID